MKSSPMGALALLLVLARAPIASLCLAALGPGAWAADWPSYNADDNATNFSPLDKINKTNVARLGLAWSMDLDEKGIIEATPLAVNGVLYFSSTYSSVYAVDAKTGKRLWKFDPEIWKHNPAKLRRGYGITRGVAYADGRIFLGAYDGRLIALEAKSGKPVWSVETTPVDGRKTITGAPHTFNGKVIIGNGVSEYGERGYVTAYDAATGRQIWRFYTVPGRPEENAGDPVMERAAKTWSGEYWKGGGGGNVWDGITFDRELNRIYIGTANANPWNPHVRNPDGGDNLFSASIVALDADTGNYIWHYQVNPNDSWDYDATDQMTLADLKIGGKIHKVLMQAPKDGFFYVIDRTDGKLLSAEKFAKVTWATRIDLATGRPVEAENIRYETGASEIWPAISGAHNWMSMSYSPKSGLVYIPAMQLGVRFTWHAGKDKDDAGEFGVSLIDGDPLDSTGTLLAWDPIQQKARWSVPRPRMWNGGVLSTAGDLVFQGVPDGYLMAHDASSGALLWRFYAGTGILGAPISYSVANQQYVAVLAGYGSANSMGGGKAKIGWKYGAQPRRLLNFSLGGTALLPPTAPPDLAVHAVDDPAIQIDPADVEPGHKLFNRKCRDCHGLDAESAGPPAPDLRESEIALRRENIWNIVHEGALLQHGMPRFPELTEGDVRQIHAYIRARAREALAGPQPPLNE